MNPRFWKDKKVFVTGHTGFQGSWLCLWLRHLGARVVGYSLPPPTRPNLFEEADLGSDLLSISGDIRNLKKLKESLREHRPDFLFHLAAQAVVGASYEDPMETYETNFLGTVTLLEALRAGDSVKATLFVTSDKCYDNQEEKRGYREGDPLGGKDPYSSSKACAELAVHAYRRSYLDRKSIGVATARTGNVIGGGDWGAKRLIPDLIRALEKNEAPRLRSPRSTRPWLHVLDALHGYLLLAERLSEDPTRYAQAWNLGGEENAEVKKIAEELIRLWGGSQEWLPAVTPHLPEHTYLQLDCSKARQEIGWFPRLSLPTALDWIVDWQREYRNHADAKKVCLKQIRRFQEMLFV